MPGCKVLIIDDDEDDVEILAEVFTQCGVEEVHYVFSVMEAFVYLQETEHNYLPKLIVTDLYLPRITGAEFLTDLKKMDKYKHIHVVVLSSAKTSSEIKRYKAMGAVDYLQKPSTYDDYMNVAAAIKKKLEVK